MVFLIQGSVGFDDRYKNIGMRNRQTHTQIYFNRIGAKITRLPKLFALVIHAQRETIITFIEDN